MPRQENTYEKIMDTALNLLARNGYAGTSIKDIPTGSVSPRRPSMPTSITRVNCWAS